MDNRLLNFAIRLFAKDEASRVIQGVQEKFERLNSEVSKTAKLREAAGNIAVASAGMGAAAAVIAYPLKEAVEKSEELEDHMNRLSVSMGDVKNKSEVMARSMDFVKKQSVESGYSANDLTESLYHGVSGFLDYDQAMAANYRVCKTRSRYERGSRRNHQSSNHTDV